MQRCHCKWQYTILRSQNVGTIVNRKGFAKKRRQTKSSNSAGAKKPSFSE
ncbi:hypothetical protein C7S15_1055 [Burkholderia cepacia]|nr:hypothetical protein [Burkholderia cepacia]